MAVHTEWTIKTNPDSTFDVKCESTLNVSVGDAFMMAGTSSTACTLPLSGRTNMQFVSIFVGF